MKQLYVALLLMMLLLPLVACSPGHVGGNEIAFIRDGQLWTIDPDGTNAFAIVTQDTPVIGYNWSPTHQLLSFRTLDAAFAKTRAAKNLPAASITGLIGDVPSTLNTIGVDGGSPIPIAISNPDTRYSNTMWNTTGTRLLYRQTPQASAVRADQAYWWVAQNDQPAGIAVKTLPGSYSIPSLSYHSNATIGNSQQGIFTTTIAGTNLRALTHTALPGHPLSASLERILWQPAHQDASVLYAITPSQQQANTDALTVQLVQRSMSGNTTVLATCTCTQFAWSPDGNHVLYSTGTAYTILDVNKRAAFTLAGEDGSVPYWSPDSQFLLLDGLHTLELVHIARQQHITLLSDSASVPTTSQQTTPVLPTTNARLQPVANSLWSADSRHFLFLTRERLLWQGHTLSTGKGLYTVGIDGAGRPQGDPVVVDTGNDTQAGWTYQDANTSFLY
jgi:hypothetical protein